MKPYKPGPWVMILEEELRWENWKEVLKILWDVEMRKLGRKGLCANNEADLQ